MNLVIDSLLLIASVMARGEGFCLAFGLRGMPKKICSGLRGYKYSVS